MVSCNVQVAHALHRCPDAAVLRFAGLWAPRARDQERGAAIDGWLIRVAIVQAWTPATSCSTRLNDPDPPTQVMGELDLLDRIFGSSFVERWLEWNAFEDELREWRSERADPRTPLGPRSLRDCGPTDYAGYA